jgi:hypothetical protein
MMDDEQSQTLNMLDVMQRDSYVETISNILDISQGNEVLKIYFFADLPEP